MAQAGESSKALFIGPGRYLAAFATTVLLICGSLFAVDANTAEEEPGAAGDAKPAVIIPGKPIKLPKPGAADNPASTLPDWNSAWKLMLQGQIDELFAAVERRTTLQTAELTAGDLPPRIQIDDDLGFKIHIVGDSTMEAQAKLLTKVLLQRTTSDGKTQCFKTSAKTANGDWTDLWCTGTEQVVGADGNEQNNSERVVLSLHYTKTFDGCVSKKVDADFVYFGCGMHFLQLIPIRTQERARLDAWVHYERLLEEAVLFYRSGGKKEGNRVPVGEAFMTTHSITENWLDQVYKPYVRKYAERKESLLSTCREVVGGLELVHTDWPNEYEPEKMCTLGDFDDSGVAGLNRRAEGVMGRLGVPIVKGYDITKGQMWTAPPHDGRHYPSLVPVELSSMLSEVTTALRREWSAAAV